MRIFGLIGERLSHSFSKSYFEKKWKREKITNTQYINFELSHISKISEIVKKKEIEGLNITTPYKTEIIPYLNNLSEKAKEINAVNTVKIHNGNLIGFNTDIVGFRKSITGLINKKKSALILGNGGASKAIQYTLKELGICYRIVSRGTLIDYNNLNDKIVSSCDIIINTTPLGMYPNTDTYPDINYSLINTKHLVFDLTYNPSESLFLKKAKNQGATIKNGLEMLELQAEASWKIWNNKFKIKN